MCAAACPSGRFTAFNTRRLLRLAQVGRLDEIIDMNELWYCTTCNTCVQQCPGRVGVIDALYILRNLAVRKGHMAQAHREVAGQLMQTGHMVVMTDEIRKTRRTLGLAEEPLTTIADSRALDDLRAICQALGFDSLISGLKSKEAEPDNAGGDGG